MAKIPLLNQLPVMAPQAVYGGMSVDELVNQSYWAHNSRAFRDACGLFSAVASEDNCVVGLSVGGALVPAGLGESALIPLMKAHLVDWVVSTGANLYHDLHAQLGYEMRLARDQNDDRRLRDEGVIRIHNVAFDQQALFVTDRFLQEFFEHLSDSCPDKHLSTSRVCKLLGERLLSLDERAARRSILAAAAAEAIPVFCPAIADSSIGMNAAAVALRSHALTIDPLLDITESAALVYAARKRGCRTGAVILGGGVAKNFQLQTEPHIQEVLGLSDTGHDFFIQFTDARVDTGGLSGATPSEAVTWGKIDPNALSNTVVCYADCTLVLPLFVAYVLAKPQKRKAKRLLDELDQNVRLLREHYAHRLRS
ncbi:MAG TPA: deoxyhypusine synthase [Phycisphaerae bacterium]|nr:deoxyhypusine synthase [Phycisphaerae bacterium]HUU84725.1 deoxyhypusine synthase [Phycisphaerae bacterium]